MAFLRFSKELKLPSKNSPCINMKRDIAKHKYEKKRENIIGVLVIRVLLGGQKVFLEKRR